MRFEGKLARDGRFWLAEIPLLDAMTQGRTKAEALEMIGGWLETMIDRKGFHARVHPTGKYEFEVSGSSAAAMTALLCAGDVRPAAPRFETWLRAWEPFPATHMRGTNAEMRCRAWRSWMRFLKPRDRMEILSSANPTLRLGVKL